MKSYITDYGFVFGPAEVLRITSDEKLGVLVQIKTPRQTQNIRITKSGLIRPFNIRKANEE